MKIIPNICFYRNTKLISVDIPDTVETIGNTAFCNCVNLTEIELPQKLKILEVGSLCDLGITHLYIPETVSMMDGGVYANHKLINISVAENNSDYISVDGIVFSKDQTRIVAYSAGRPNESYIIPDSVTEIGECSLYACHNLKNLTLSGNVMKIGDSGLLGLKLSSIELPSKLTYIGNHALYACRDIESIDIPNTVTFIGKNAFGLCSSLKNATIPKEFCAQKNSLLTRCFSNCNLLDDLTCKE